MKFKGISCGYMLGISCFRCIITNTLLKMENGVMSSKAKFRFDDQ